MKRCAAGFTLVELVIVVVVTGILLLILIPTYDIGSRRDKVARAQSDQRSLATAIESYVVDWGTYLPSAYPTKNASASQLTFCAYALLTTPVSYITAIPSDVFAARVARGASNGWQTGVKNPLIYYSGYGDKDGKTKTLDPTMRRSAWVLVSVGPDGKNGVSVDGNDPVSDPDPARTPYDPNPGGVGAMLKSGTTVQAPTSVRAADGGAWTDVTYDPSNGMNSKGDIVKFNSGAALPRFISR